MGERVRVEVIVSGRVQGVGFRWSTVDEARRLGLDGWVRNLPDGRVEAEAEGERPAVEALLRFLQRGPPGARVDDVEVRWGAPAGALGPFTTRR
ncbi:MAG: acylphosphatase [Anaeromyxobacter sp.]